MFSKHNIGSIQVMSDEERKNPKLIKERQDFKENPISIYYGSEKKDLVDVCANCKKRHKCNDYFNTKEQAMQLRRAADISELTMDLSPEEIEKLRSNVFIVVNCIYKEEK